jgi:magnesium-transporting ATPase (P-type)
MIEETLLSGAWMGLAAYAFYAWALASGWSEFDVRNALLFLMVLFENVHVFNCRSETRSAFRVPLSANWPVVLAVAGAQGLHIAAGYMPGLSGVLNVAPISIGLWLTLLPIALSPLVVMELFKAAVRARGGRLAAQSGATEPTR